MTDAERVKKVLESGDICPKCKSNANYFESVDIDDEKATQDGYCFDCETSWTDTYTFKSREIKADV